MEPSGLQELWKKNILSKLWSADDARPAHCTDLIFRCLDGSVAAHKLWLANCCTTLREAVNGMHVCADEKVTVVVPDYSVKVVKNFLQLFYTGSVKLSDRKDLEQVQFSEIFVNFLSIF
jgi:hypothetical protein